MSAPRAFASGRPSLVAVLQAPTPYYVPILNALVDEVDLHVIFSGEARRPENRDVSWADFEDAWGEAPRFEYSFLPSRSLRLRRLDLNTRFAFGASRVLHRLRPDVVLVHSWGPMMLEPLLWARAMGRATMMWNESTLYTGVVRDRASMLVRRFITRLIDAFVVTGDGAADFVGALGASRDRVAIGCLPSALASRIASARRPAAATGGLRFLFVGRLVPLKDPLTLAKAFTQNLQTLPNSTLTFVGDGPLRTELQRLSDDSEGRIRLVGRCEGTDLIEHYLEADVLVLTSQREVWGLVVNEALAAGLFVIVTDHVGCASSLIDEHSGMIVPRGNVDALAAAMRRAAAADHGEAARAYRAKRVHECTPAAFAHKVRVGVDLALEQRRNA